MAQKTFVVLVYFVSDESLLPKDLCAYHTLKLLYNFLENRLIKHQALAIHHAYYIIARKQFATFKYNSIASGIKNIEPKFLVEYLPCEDKHLHLRKLLLGVATNLNANSGRATQSKV